MKYLLFFGFVMNMCGYVYFGNDNYKLFSAGLLFGLFWAVFCIDIVDAINERNGNVIPCNKKLKL